MPSQDSELEHYEPSAPGIKVTVGLVSPLFPQPALLLMSFTSY